LAKDLVYQAAKNALIKDNWLITHDLYTISFGGVNMQGNRMLIEFSNSEELGLKFDGQLRL
jgi:hypothetical protein